MSMQSAPLDVKKFQFDEFEGDGLDDSFGIAAPEVELTFTQAELDAAKQAAAAEGFARGQADADARIEAEIARLLAQIAAAADKAVADQARIQDTIGAESVRLAALIARKVLPAMAESGGLKEIEALIARCLSERPEESRLVIRLHDTMLDKIEARLATITTETGFAGKPILLADPTMAKTEVRIEWANGGVDWSFAKQLSQIESTCQRLSATPSKVKAYTTPHDDSPMTEIVDEYEASHPNDPGE